MKKFLSFVLIITLLGNLFVLAGCNQQSNENDMGKIEFKQFTNDDVSFENDTLFVKNQLLITAGEKYSYSDIEKAVSDYGGKIVGCIEFTNDYQVEFENADYNKLTEIMSDLSNALPDSDITLHNAYMVDYASRDYKESYTNDYSTKDGNWWRQSIELNDLENKKYDYQTVKVGLVDTLFDTQNPDLSDYFVRDGVLYNDESKLAEEADSSHGNHGTNVTGFLAAKKGNGIGIDGVANNVDLYGVAQSESDKLTDDFSGDLYDNNSSSMKWKYSIAHLLSQGVKIINISMVDGEMMVGAVLNNRQAKRDLSTWSECMEVFLKKYIDHGQQFVIIKSAGNENGETYIYCKEGITKEHPYGIKCYNSKTDGNLSDYEKCSFTATADLDELGAIKAPEVKNRIIIVGSSTKDNNRANHSVSGERIDIYAPGENLTKLTTGELGSGTSFAAPIVSGIAALIWGINPGISADNIKFIINSQATKPIVSEMGKTESYKFLVNANNAVEFAKNFKTTITMESGKNNGKLLGYVRKLNDNQEIEELNSGCNISIFKGSKEEAYANVTDSNYQEPVAYANIPTDINGEFDIDLPEGDYYLTASCNNDEYQSVIKTFSIQKGEVCYLDDIILTKTVKHYTAMDLINKDLSEIVGLMGDDYNLERKDFSPAFGTGGGTYMIYNENTMPGLAVCPSYSSGIYKDIENGVNVREKIHEGAYFYDGIAIVGNGKLNDKISADMTYNELATEIGDFDAYGAAQTIAYSTKIDGNRVSFAFDTSTGITKYYKNGKVSSTDMKTVNPTLSSIAVYRNSNNRDISITDSDNRIQSNKIMEIKRNESYTFSGTLIKDTESMEGVVFHFLILDSPVRCRIYYSSTTSEEKDIDTIQITTGSIVNIDDYVNMRITVTGRTPFGPARAGTPDVKDIKLCADNIQVN